MLLDAPQYDVAAGTSTMDFLVGVNIDGAPCETRGKPDVYADIRAHVQWITKTRESDHQEL